METTGNLKRDHEIIISNGTFLKCREKHKICYLSESIALPTKSISDLSAMLCIVYLTFIELPHPKKTTASFHRVKNFNRKANFRGKQQALVMHVIQSTKKKNLAKSMLILRFYLVLSEHNAHNDD